MSYGFRQYVSCQSFVNSSSTAGFVFHLKFHYLVGQPLYGCVDLIIMILDLVYCLKKCILVSSGCSAQSRAPGVVWWHLCNMCETLITHKQVRLDQPRVAEAQWVGIEGQPCMQINSTALTLVASYANGLG